LYVQPAAKELVAALTGQVHEAAPNSDHGYKIRRVPNAFCKVVGQGADSLLSTGAGMEPLVRYILSAQGADVKDIGPRSALLPEPRQSAELDPAVQDLVQRNQECLLRHSSAIDLARLIAQIALAWPQHTLAAVVTRIEEARTLRDRLRQYIPGVVAITSHNHPARVGRVFTSTYMGLGHIDVDVHLLDIVVAVDAIEATSKLAVECLSHAQRAHLIGLLDNTARMAPHDEDRVRFAFGFDEVSLVSNGQAERLVCVLQAPIRTGLPGSAPTDILSLKRASICKNPLRHRLVSKLARAAASGSSYKILDAVTGRQAGQRQAVFVYVESLDHALELLGHLPGWPIVAGEGVSTEGLSQVQKQAIDRGRELALGLKPEANVSAAAPGPSPVLSAQRLTVDRGCDWAQGWKPGAIVTAAAPRPFQVPVDVLIRADAGPGVPEWLESLVQQNPGDKPLLIVDVVDRQHPQLRRWARQRHQAYRERGWPGPGGTPVTARVQHYLAKRPKGVLS
jgi:hypothetical protein